MITPEERLLSVTDRAVLVNEALDQLPPEDSLLIEDLYEEHLGDWQNIAEAMIGESWEKQEDK